MKKILPLLLSILGCLNSFSQVDTSISGVNSQTTDYSYLMKKSKNQKITAWIMLGGGLVMTYAGAAMWSNAIAREADKDPLGTLLTLGVKPIADADPTGLYISTAGMIASIASIPLFIASGKNKRRANAMSVSFKMEKTSVVKGYTAIKINYPAVSLKIRL